MEKIRVIVYGLGTIGSSIAKSILKNEYLELIGVIDNDKEKLNKDIGELIGVNKLGISVSDESILSNKADIVLHSTSSSLNEIKNQLIKIIESGSNVISTCEELSFPINDNIKIAKELDELAKKYNVTIIGSGVNPGFVLDSLIIFLTTGCQEVTEIKASRIVDISKRRIQLQRKVGIGLTIDEFNRLLKDKKIGHVGLKESAAMIASIFGINGKNKERIKPIIKDNKVIGIKQSVKIKKFISLSLQMYVGAKQKDIILIKGNPSINLVIKDGIQGDTATTAIVLNLIPKIVNYKEKGLISMKDLIPHYKF